MEEAALIKYLSLVNDQGEETGEKVASIIINRPQAANSFNGEVLESITRQLELIRRDDTVRVLLFQSFGKHFSSGADLTWMQESAKLSEKENQKEAEKLMAMYEALYQMPIPTIAIVKGAAYGGAVGLIACCDYGIATENAKFCLSEVRVGLIPAVILPYLSRKIPKGHLRRLSLTGRVFTSEEAKSMGLIQDVIETSALDEYLKREVNHLLLASPEAQKSYKDLQAYLEDHSGVQGMHTVEAISRVRVSPSGQKGLQAFFDKKEPDWVCTLKGEQRVFEI